MTLINAEPYDAVSFTDGTTPFFPPNQRRSVAIEGTTPRDSDLNWYYILLQRYTHVPGELKSEVIIKDFHTQPSNIQQAVWTGMKYVLIHITDVLPYQQAVVSIIERRAKKGWYDTLKKNAQAKDKISIEMLKWADKFIDDYVSGCLQRGSSASRFVHLMQYLEHPFDLRNYLPKIDIGFRRVEIDYSAAIDPDKTRLTVRRIAKWNTRADAIFATAEWDLFKNPSYGIYGIKEQAFRAISQAYAFDEGDHPAVKWMESARETSVDAMFPYDFWRKRFLKKLPEVDSKKSYFTQIGDIAAKFAGQIYERGGLIEVTKKFEFVTFNGERITEEIASENVRKWKQQGYI